MTDLVIATAERTIYVGTPLDLPQQVADTWRVLLWTLQLLLLGAYLSDLPGALKRWRGLPMWLVLGYLALFFVIARSAWLQFGRWGGPVTVEGLPVNTVIVLLAGSAHVSYRRWRRRRGVACP